MQHSPLSEVAVGLPVGDPTYVQGVSVITRTRPEVFRTVVESNVNPRKPVVHGGKHCKRLFWQELQEACGSSRVFLLNNVDHLGHQRREKPGSESHLNMSVGMLEDARIVPVDMRL